MGEALITRRGGSTDISEANISHGYEYCNDKKIEITLPTDYSNIKLLIVSVQIEGRVYSATFTATGERISSYSSSSSHSCPFSSLTYSGKKATIKTSTNISNDYMNCYTVVY